MNWKNRCAFITAVAASALLSQAGNAAVITSFSSVPVNTAMTSFTDPASGITFVNPTSAEGNAFAVYEDDITFSSSVTPMSYVKIIPTTMADGFGNISYQPATVPEPALMPLLLGTPLLLRRRRFAHSAVTQGD